MKHKIETIWTEALQFDAKTEHGSFKLDGPEEVGGQGKGLRAKPLMLVSLAGCTGMDVASLMKKMHLDVDSFKVEVEGDLSEEHPKMYKQVDVHYYFTGNNLNEEKLKKAVDLSVEKYCGVMAMFRTFAQVDIHLHFNE